MAIDLSKLKNSKEFLKILFDNLDTAIFIADKNLKIYQFNDSFLTLFNPVNSDVSNITFGSASGCINAVKENKPCGETSVCNNCILGQSLKKCFFSKTPIEKKSLERIFYIKGKPEKKYLEFTARLINYLDRQLLLIFVYDVTRIEQAKRILKIKQEQINIDLEKAADIQRSLLPAKRPQIPFIDVDWFFEPSHKVGGDVFHIYRENDVYTSCYMLDVSGHGISAALVAVMVKQFIDHLHIEGLKKGRPFQPETILQMLEVQFPFERFDCYFTIVCVLLNVKTGHMVYGGAGHVPPVIVGREDRFELLDRNGTIIGIGNNETLTQHEAQLKIGDKLIIYTDGLVDYFGKRGSASNTQDFYKGLQGLRNESAGRLVDKIIAQRIQKGNQIAQDDISLLVIEYVGI
ncbi:MAG: SpoIIE family protein phosphatase [Desulfobacula sp.]|nr:SpoIIE family protein phosphatase [Desulfobacula sp.]